jgi:hypothetical protein
MPEGILNLQVEVLLRLTERNLSASQQENIEDDARTRVVDYIESLPMGADLIYNKLLGHIVEPEEVADAVLLIRTAPPGEPVSEIYKSNLATAGRKAKVEVQRVFVGLMGESVSVDILVRLEKTKQAEGKVEVSQALDAAIKEAVGSTLSAAERKLSKAALRTAIGAAVATTDDRLQLIADNAVVLNAEYKETGRLLNNTDEVSVEEHQVLELRNVNIEMTGDLDV